MASPIEEVIAAAKAARSSANNDSILDESTLTSIRDDLLNSISTHLRGVSDKAFPQQLKNNIQTVLPAILEATLSAQNDSLNNRDDEEKRGNLKVIDDALQSAYKALEQLDQNQVFNSDLDFDPKRLESISNALDTLNQSITTAKNNTHNSSTSANLTTAQKNLNDTQRVVQDHVEANTRANAPAEDFTLNTKKITEDIKTMKTEANDFRNSLSSLFNLHATGDLSHAADLFENINKSALTASEAIELLQNLSINTKMDSPEAIQSANLSLNDARREIENLINQSQQANSFIVQSSMGDITNFYTKLLRMGSSANTSTAEIKANLKKLNISNAERQQLEQALDENKKKLEDLLNITHEEFTTAFSKKITDIVSGIDTETNKMLNQFAVGRGISQKYISSFNQAGQAATNIWQIATGIEQTKDRFSIGSFGLGRPNLSAIKEDASIAGQLHFELANSIREFAGTHDKAIELKQKGLHNQSQAALDRANKMAASIVEIQAEFSARSLRAIKKWNSLSEKEKKRLDPSGQMENNIKTLSRQVLSGNTSVISLTQAFNIKMNSTTKRQLEQLKSDTKDIAKLDQEVKKSKDKTEFTIRQLSNFIQSAVNEVRSIISSTKNIFNTFGNLGTAFLGPIDSLKKLYDYYRKQGQAKYKAMGTDAYIGYSDLNDSAERAYSRLMAGDELYVRSGGRIDRDAYDKQYQAILRQIGGRYGATPEQAVQDAEVLSKQATLLKNVYGVDDSSIMQVFKTYLKDMDKSPEETIDALAKLTTQAQAANIPLGQYLSKVSNLSETFMRVGIEGEQASIILNQLLQNGVRMEVAESVTSQVASVASKFSDDKNKIAFAGVLQGEDPFHAIAMAMYTHTADGKPREGWGQEIGKKLDTWMNIKVGAYGDDPDKRFMGTVDFLKEEGFDQRAASMLAVTYTKYGNNKIFQDMLVNEMNKQDNPNAKMEDLNKKINAQLEQMVNQLAGSDRLAAQLDSKLYREAQHFGRGLDSILKTLTPAIIEFQKQMLIFTTEALKMIQKLVTSDIFKGLIDSVVQTISNIPNFLKDLESKLDELIGWGQSLIEGEDNTDKNADQLKNESHSPFDDTTSLPATGLGMAAGILTPGGIITKTIATYIFTNLFDKIGDAINNAAVAKDDKGNVIKDENGNVKYNDNIFGNTVEWLSDNDRPWNDKDNPLAVMGSVAATAVIAKALGNIPALSLTKEGSKIARLGARGIIAAAIGGLIKYTFSDPAKKEKTEDESVIDKFFNLFSGKDEKVLGVSEVRENKPEEKKSEEKTTAIQVSSTQTSETKEQNTKETGIIDTFISSISNMLFTKASAASLDTVSQDNVSKEELTKQQRFTNLLIDNNKTLERISVDSQINKSLLTNIASAANISTRDQSIYNKSIQDEQSANNFFSANQSDEAILDNDFLIKASFDEYKIANQNITTNETAKTDETSIKNEQTKEENITYGAYQVANQEQASLLDVIGISLGLTATPMVAYNFVTGFNKPIGEALVYGGEALSPAQRFKAAFYHLISVFKQSFTDIKNIIKNFYEAMISLPSIIRQSIDTKITDIKNYIKSIPETLKSTARAKIIDNWRVAGQQVKIENNINAWNKRIKNLEKKLQLNPGDESLINKLEKAKAYRSQLQTNYANKIQEAKINSARSWLPKFQSSKYQQAFNEFNKKFNANDFYKNLNETAKLTEEINVNKGLIQIADTDIKTIQQRLKTEKSIDARSLLQKDLNKLLSDKEFFTNTNIKYTTALEDATKINKLELERIIGTSLTESEFIKINTIIEDNKKARESITDLKKLAQQQINNLTKNRADILKKYTSGSYTYEQYLTKAKKIDETIKLIQQDVTSSNGIISKLEQSIKQSEANLGKQINNANSFLRRITSTGFETTKILISKTSSILGEAIGSVAELAKQSIINTAKSMLRAIGTIFGNEAKSIVENLFKRARNMLKVFEPLLNGIKQIARFFGIGGATTEATRGLGLLSKFKQAGQFLVNHIPGLQNIVNKFKALPPAFIKGAGWLFKKIPWVNAVATAGSFGMDFVSNLERGADWTTALKVAFGDNLEKIIEAAAMFGGPYAWAGYAANNILPILHMFGFNVPEKTLLSLLGDFTGIHASYSEDEKIAEFSKDLAQRYPELAQNPELLKKVAAGQMSVEQAFTSMINEASSGQMGPEEMRKWLEQEQNAGNELAIRIADAVDKGIISIDDAVEQLQTDPKKITERIAQAEKEAKAAAEPTESAEDTEASKETDKANEYKRKYKDSLKELERVKTLENISDIKKQEIIKLLIDEQTTKVNNEYTNIKNKINISNLTDEKKTEAFSKLEEEHLKHINNIEKLKNNQITEEQFNQSYTESKKELEKITGLYFTSVNKEENIKNIKQRYYVDPIKEAQRILSVSNKYDTEHKQIITNLSQENINRVDKDYQYMQKKINESSLSEDKKKELTTKLNKQYEIDKQRSQTLKTDLNNITNANDANALLQQFQQSYDKSKAEIEEATELEYEDGPETAEEAEESRTRMANKIAENINDEQKKSQDLQRLTNVTIDDFMDLHEELMASLQKSISEDHKGIYDSIGVTHKILLELHQSIARAGAAIAYTLARGGGGTGSRGNTSGDISAITNQPEIEAKLEAAAKQFGVDPALVKAIAQAESGWKQDTISPVGAIGIMQLMPETAAGLGVNPNNIDQNIYGGVKYLKQMLDTFNGNVELAVAAYNAGPGAVQQYNKVPPYSETQNYVRKVLNYREGYVGREVLPKNETGQSVGNHPSERKARQDAAAIAQSETINWTNDNERLLYETLADMEFDGKQLRNTDLAGIMAYVKYANPNFDMILNEEHGGIFALGGANKEKALQILKESNKDPNNKIAQIVASVRALGIERNYYHEQNEDTASVMGSRLAIRAGWDDTDIERVQEQAKKYFNKFSNQTAVLGISEERTPTVSDTIQQGANALKPVDQGGAGTGTGRYISQFTASYDPGVSCTDASATMMYNMYTGSDLSIDQFRSQFGTWSMNAVMLNELNSWSVDITDPHSSDMQQVYTNIANGQPTLLYYQDRVGPNAFTNSGMHAVIAVGINSDGTIKVINPNDQGFSAIQNVSKQDIENPLLQGNRLAVYTPNAKPKNIITGPGTSTSSGSPSPSGGYSNQYSGWTMQDFYNYIIGAPAGFQGTYNINPYTNTTLHEFEKLYKTRMQNIEDVKQKREERQEQRRLEREQKYGTPASGQAKADNKTDNKTDEAKKKEEENILAQKNSKLEEAKKAFAEQKAELENVVRRTIDVEYTYNSDDTLYKNRLIQDQIDKEKLLRIANYNYKYTTKPRFIDEAYIDNKYILPYTYEAIDKMPEYDLTIEEQNLYQSNKTSTIITEEEYNSLNEDKKEEYTNITAEKHITAEQFKYLSDKAKQYYTLNANAIINNYKTDIQYQQEPDKAKYRPIINQVINQEQYNQLPRRLQELYSIKTNTQFINQEKYDALSEDDKKNYEQRDTIVYKKKVKPTSTQYVYEKIDKVNEYKLQEQYKSLAGTPLYQKDNPITEKDGIVTIDFGQTVTPEQGSVQSGVIKEELTFEEWNQLPEELKNKYTVNPEGINQNYLSQAEYNKKSKAEQAKYKSTVLQKHHNKRINAIKKQYSSEDINEIEEIITQEQYNKKSKAEKALYEPVVANVYYKTDIDKQYQLNDMIYAKDTTEVQNILSGNIYKLNDQSEKLYQLIESTTNEQNVISQNEYQQLSKEEQAKYKQMNSYINKSQYDKLSEQDKNKYYQLDINNIITQQQWNKLSDKEKQQYNPVLTMQVLTQEQFEQLPQHMKDLYQQQRDVGYKRKKIYEKMSKADAFAIANQQLTREKLKTVDDDKLLKYYNIKVNDEKNKKQIIKNIRQRKDLQGNKIDKKELDKLIEAGLTEDQAYIQYLATHDKDKQISILGNIDTTALYDFTKNYYEKSKHLKKIDILRSKQQTDKANIQVEGYEKGKKVSFWTDEAGAEKFYNNQQQLYKAANGKDIQQSAFFSRLLGEELKQMPDDKDTTNAGIAEATTKVLQRMTQWQEFNMTKEELLQYLGINVNQPGYLGELAQDQIYNNLINGLSPSGKPWIDDILSADAKIRQMIAGEFNAADAKDKELQDQIDILKTRQQLDESTIHRLALQYVLVNDDNNIYGNVEVTDPLAQAKLSYLKTIEEFYTPGELSFTDKHPEQLVSFNTYYGGLWGESMPQFANGLGGRDIWKILSQPNADGEKIANYNPRLSADIKAEHTKQQRKALIPSTYEGLSGRKAAAMILHIPSAISGTTPEAQAKARNERETWRTYGDVARRNTAGELDVKKAYKDGRTNYAIRDKETGGKNAISIY